MIGNHEAQHRIAEKLQGLIVKASGLFGPRRDLLMGPRAMRYGAFEQRPIAKVVVDDGFQVIQVRSLLFVLFQNGDDCNKRRMLGRKRSNGTSGVLADPAE